VDARRLVFYEPNVLFDYGADTHHEALGVDNAGFSFHVYCLAASPGVPALARGRLQDLACSGQEQRVFGLAEKHCASSGAVPLLSEFGASDDLRSVGRVARLADRNMVSWQYWAYFNRDPCCERPEEGLVRDLDAPPTADNVKQDKLSLLARAYPRAVAGTPERFDFEPSSACFELTYSTAPVGGGRFTGELETEVFLPRIHYPAGYRAEVDGATVTSEGGANVLRLAALSGAGRVSLSVSPEPPQTG
jgi:endoglycosylceramidase